MIYTGVFSTILSISQKCSNLNGLVNYSTTVQLLKNYNARAKQQTLKLYIHIDRGHAQIIPMDAKTQNHKELG